MLTVYLANRFKRSFKKLPAVAQEDFIRKIEIFRAHPFHPSLGTHKLKGRLGDYYAFVLRDGHRVLFYFIDDRAALLVNIGKHDDYKRW